MNIPLATVTVVNGRVLGITVADTYFDMGELAEAEKCVYGNCRMRNLCKPKTCIGINFDAYNYELEFSSLVDVTYERLNGIRR